MSEPLLHEISLLPGVIGCCLLDRVHGLREQERMAGLSSQTVAELGERLSRMLQMSRTLSLAASALELSYDRLLLIGIPLTGERLLLVLCETNGNVSLVARTAHLLATDLTAVGGAGNIPGPEIADIDLMEIEQEEDENAALSEQWSDEVVESVAFIRDALLHTIGPVAFMLMQDYLARWTAGGPPDPQRLPELVDLIAASLRDPTRTATFLKHLKR